MLQAQSHLNYRSGIWGLGQNVNLSKTPENYSDHLAPVPRCFEICCFHADFVTQVLIFLLQDFLATLVNAKRKKQTKKAPSLSRIL